MNSHLQRAASVGRSMAQPRLELPVVGTAFAGNGFEPAQYLSFALPATEPLFSASGEVRRSTRDFSNPHEAQLIGDSATQYGSIQDLLMPAVYVCHMMREFPDPTAIPHGSNLLLSDIELPGQYITVAQNLKCVANAMKLARSPEWYLPWGLRIAEYIHGPLTPALLTAPTLGDGLDVFLEYFELRIPSMGIRSRLAAGTLFGRASSWYMATNIPGKAAQMINYLIGMPDYLEQWRAVKAAGYAGFVFN